MVTQPVINVAIAGNPNSGKTTMFNVLTGARHKVGNYPGITVESREGKVRVDDYDVNLVDLPGIYSLTAYSQEELVARDYLVEKHPYVVVDIINAGNLERNLYLALQFLEMGTPLILALNMMDEVKKQGKVIDTEKLKQLLEVPAVETIARSGVGKQELLTEVVKLANERKGRWKPLVISYGPDLDPVLKEMEVLIEKEQFLTERYPARWIALKYLEQDIQIINLGKKRGGKKNSRLWKKLEEMVDKVSHHCLVTLDTDPESIIADYRYGYIASLLKRNVIKTDDRTERIAWSDKMDLVLTNRFLGPLIMVWIFYAMFKITFTIGEIPMSWVTSIFKWCGDIATGLIPEGLFQSLVVSGIINGVGSVLGFVPLILLMFLMIAFLEDSGYMARMAYMLDRILRIFGLHGSSVMPFIISGGIPGGCAVPGVMAARTLRSPKEKTATLLVAPFMTCGAKVPVFIVITAAFFKADAAGAFFWITLGSWIIALLVAKVLRSTVIRGRPTPFVMELPPYRLPTLKGIWIHTTERVWQYVKKAGTVILGISILLWAAMTFPRLPQEEVAAFQTQCSSIQNRISKTQGKEQKKKLAAKLVKLNNNHGMAALKHSIAGKIGIAIEPVSKLAGFDWRTNIALIGGFAAKEVIVSTLGTAYSLGNVDPDSAGTLSDRLASDPQWNILTAISMIIFVLLYAPCSVTVVVIAKESSWKWAVFSVVFNTVLAFTFAAIVFQVGSFITVGWVS